MTKSEITATAILSSFVVVGVVKIYAVYERRQEAKLQKHLAELEASYAEWNDGLNAMIVELDAKLEVAKFWEQVLTPED